jgi:hypothetical protein
LAYLPSARPTAKQLGSAAPSLVQKCTAVPSEAGVEMIAGSVAGTHTGGGGGGAGFTSATGGGGVTTGGLLLPPQAAVTASRETISVPSFMAAKLTRIATPVHYGGGVAR